MRYIYAWLLLVSSISYLALAGPSVERIVHSPQGHAEVALGFLSALQKIDAEEAENTRFLSFYNLNKDKNREKYVKISDFWNNNLHFQSDTTKMKAVPGTNNTLFAIDLRDFGWSPAAFSAVANREPYFREPFVNTGTAESLREIAHLKQQKPDKKFLDTPHIELIVRADWFFRETMESDRSPSYYDLLYSRQRFPEKGHFVDFPQNEAAVERLLGIDKVRKFIDDSKIDVRHGAVVEGAEKGVSLVARQNRLIERLVGFIGSYYKTYDVKETTGNRDFAETLHKDFEFDAGEILFDLPAGGMGTLLVDSKGTILETADNRFATDQSDLRYDSRVRTATSCFICHESKYIMPENLVEDLGKSGIDIKFKKKKDAIDARAFFLGWTKKLKNEQDLAQEFIAKTSGFKPGENARIFKQWRDQYDGPVNFETVLQETGIPEATLKIICSKSPKARVLMLLRGKSIPRKTFEIDVYRQIMLLENAGKDY
jgi:hypothetical protein